MKTEPAHPKPDRRLRSWKEIAQFFGKDERTVKRWEVQRGPPVHRVPGGSRTSVYAYAHELEEWLRSPPAAIRIDRSFKKLWQNEDFRALAAEIGFPFPQTAGLPAQTVPQ